MRSAGQERRGPGGRAQTIAAHTVHAEEDGPAKNPHEGQRATSEANRENPKIQRPSREACQRKAQADDLGASQRLGEEGLEDTAWACPVAVAVAVWRYITQISLHERTCPRSTATAGLELRVPSGSAPAFEEGHVSSGKPGPPLSSGSERPHFWPTWGKLHHSSTVRAAAAQCQPPLFLPCLPLHGRQVCNGNRVKRLSNC